MPVPTDGGRVAVSCAGEGLFRYVTIAGLVLALALLAACGAFSEGPAEEVPFETLEHAAYSGTIGESWDVDAPGLAIIADSSDVEQIDAFVSPDAEMKLRALDYDTRFALAAFMGFQGCYESDFKIERVLLRKNELELYASRPVSEFCRPMASSPYHIIALSRSGIWQEATHFTLYLNGEHAVSGSYPPVVSQATPAPTPTQEPTLAQTPRPTETPPSEATVLPTRTPGPGATVRSTPISPVHTSPPMKPTETGQPSASPTHITGPCPVTLPNGRKPPDEPSNSLQHGNSNDTMWTELWPEGQVIFRPDGPGEIRPDGSLAMKWPWWYLHEGQLTIVGRRLDAPAPPLQAEITLGYHGPAFQPSTLLFSTEGCWEITGSVGEATLTFVTLVTQAEE